MKTEKEVKDRIEEVEKAYHHVLIGTRATIVENAPRALMQLAAEVQLEILNWVLGNKFSHKYDGDK